MSDEIITWEFLKSISENYPIAYIAVILTAFGFILGATGVRFYVKVMREVVIKALDRIIEKLM